MLRFQRSYSYQKNSSNQSINIIIYHHTIIYTKYNIFSIKRPCGNRRSKKTRMEAKWQSISYLSQLLSRRKMAGLPMTISRALARVTATLNLCNKHTIHGRMLTTHTDRKCMQMQIFLTKRWQF